MPWPLLHPVPRRPRVESEHRHHEATGNEPTEFLPNPGKHITPFVYLLEILPQGPEFLHRAIVKLSQLLCDTFIRDPCHLEVGFREHAPHGGIMGTVARTVRDEKHIRYL